MEQHVPKRTDVDPPLAEAYEAGRAAARKEVIAEIREWARQTIIAPVEVFRDREKLLARLDELEKS